MLTKLPLELLDLCCFWAAATPVDCYGTRPRSLDGKLIRPQQVDLLRLALTCKTLSRLALKHLYSAPVLTCLTSVELFSSSILEPHDSIDPKRLAWYRSLVRDLTVSAWHPDPNMDWRENFGEDAWDARCRVYVCTDKVCRGALQHLRNLQLFRIVWIAQ